MSAPVKGQCLCGGVAFSARFADRAEFGVCHCKTCQRWNGGPGLAGDFVDLDFSSSATLKWYDSSDWGQRGFCGACGANLFFRLKEHPDAYFIQIGCLDLPDGADLAEHIFIDAKPDYYDFKDSAPRLTGAQFLARFEDNET